MFTYYSCGDDCYYYPRVAIYKHSQWEEKKKHKLFVKCKHFPMTFALVFTIQSVQLIFNHGVVDKEFEARNKANAPDDYRQKNSIAAPALSAGYYTVDHSQVAIKCHESEEEDGAVETEIEATIHQLAE